MNSAGELLKETIVKTKLAMQNPAFGIAQTSNCAGPLSGYKGLAEQGFAMAVFTSITQKLARNFLEGAVALGYKIQLQYPAKRSTDFQHVTRATIENESGTFVMETHYFDINGVSTERRKFDPLFRICSLNSVEHDISCNTAVFLVTLMQTEVKTCNTEESCVKESCVEETAQETPQEVPQEDTQEVPQEDMPEQAQESVEQESVEKECVEKEREYVKKGTRKTNTKKA